MAASIVEGTAISVLHPAFGSFWDSRDGFFTLVDIASFAPFAVAFSLSKTSPLGYLTAYSAIILSAPGAFYIFDLFMWMEFSAADGIYFPAAAGILLVLNALVYRKSTNSQKSLTTARDNPARQTDRR